jgi:hypothetical protein
VLTRQGSSLERRTVVTDGTGRQFLGARAGEGVVRGLVSHEIFGTLRRLLLEVSFAGLENESDSCVRRRAEDHLSCRDYELNYGSGTAWLGEDWPTTMHHTLSSGVYVCLSTLLLYPTRYSTQVAVISPQVEIPGLVTLTSSPDGRLLTSWTPTPAVSDTSWTL